MRFLKRICTLSIKILPHYYQQKLHSYYPKSRLKNRIFHLIINRSKYYFLSQNLHICAMHLVYLQNIQLRTKNLHLPFFYGNIYKTRGIQIIFEPHCTAHYNFCTKLYGAVWWKLILLHSTFTPSLESSKIIWRGW